MAIRFVLDEHLRGPLWRAVQRHNAREEDPIPTHLATHLAGGHRLSGIFMMRPAWSVRGVVEPMVLAAYASENDEWQDRIEYLPPAGT